MACRTQFQYAPNGLPTGLRYGDCLPVLRQRAKAWRVPRDRWDEMFEGLQLIEQAFVSAMREVAERDRKSD